ncbi:MAG: class I SAM-dependent methyltransferase, partial [Candidatus Helarchaeota archaeon]
MNLHILRQHINSREWSKAWFNNYYHEDVYCYIENRFSPIVLKYLNKTKGKVLDAACGFRNSYLEKAKIDKSLCFGLDIDPTVIVKNSFHKNFIINDLHYFRSKQKFEIIISVYTWEHLHSPDIVLNNFYNSLTEQGIVIIIAPQKWHYASIVGRIISNTLKKFVWRALKGHDTFLYPAFYHLCSRKSLYQEAYRQDFDIMHFS